MSTIEELAEPLSGEEPADTGQEENIRYFRDILLRLTFAAHGWDDRLDGVLEQLQDELRSKDALPDLKNYSEILYRALMRAEESRPAREPGQIVAKAFSDLEFPPQLKEEWGSLMEQSRLAKDEVQALEVLEQCASLLGRALKEAPATKAGKKPGLLASLFGSDNRDQDESGKFIKAVQPACWNFSPAPVEGGVGLADGTEPPRQGRDVFRCWRPRYRRWRYSSSVLPSWAER